VTDLAEDVGRERGGVGGGRPSLCASGVRPVPRCEVEVDDPVSVRVVSSRLERTHDSGNHDATYPTTCALCSLWRRQSNERESRDEAEGVCVRSRVWSSESVFRHTGDTNNIVISHMARSPDRCFPAAPSIHSAD